MEKTSFVDKLWEKQKLTETRKMHITFGYELPEDYFKNCPLEVTENTLLRLKDKALNHFDYLIDQVRQERQ